VQDLPASMSKLKKLKTVKLGNNKLGKQQQSKIRALLPNVNIDFENQWDDSNANAND